MLIRQQNNKDYIFCEFRRRFVRLTPEEWVRQNFLRRLVEDFHYLRSRIVVEAIVPGERRSRLDALVYNERMEPTVLLEFKREDVPLTQHVLDQAAVYNRHYHVPYLIVSNGPQTIVARVLETEYQFLENIPEWNQL